jgi:hypothetical protein
MKRIALLFLAVTFLTSVAATAADKNITSQFADIDGAAGYAAEVDTESFPLSMSIYT